MDVSKMYKAMVGIKRAGLKYVRKGLPIIPICPPEHFSMSHSHRERCSSPGKMPLISKWTEHTETTEQEWDKWLNTWSYMNIGLPMGQASGYVGIDVDGEEGLSLLAEMSGGDLPPTWEFKSGNGHRYLYTIPEGLKTKKVTNKGEGVHQECSILCDGQQTVLPPSMHAAERLYTWVEGHSPEDISCAGAPQWVLNKISITGSSDDLFAAADFMSEVPDEKGFKDYTEAKNEHVKMSEEDWSTDVVEGGRNDRLTKMAGALIAKRNMPKDSVLEYLLTWNNRHCVPPLPENEISVMVDHLYEIELEKNKEMTEAAKKVFNSQEFVYNFINYYKRRGIRIAYDMVQARFFIYEERRGFWYPVEHKTEKIQMGKIIRPILTHVRYGNPKWDTSAKITEAMDALKEELALIGPSYSIFDMGDNAIRLSEFINLQNGLYYWKDDELRPHTHESYSTAQLNVAYDEKARCDIFEQALKDWLPDSNTRRFVQEYVGLCLVPDTSFRTAVILYGAGANGKSMFIETISRLFGEVISFIPLHRLGQRFETAFVQNKLLNVNDDLDPKFLNETGIIKQLIAGGRTRAEHKGGKVFDFTPTARLLFSCNKLPNALDKSEGWYSRLKIVHFAQTFETNSHFKKEFDAAVTQELPGILNWAVEGLVRLNSANAFTTSVDMDKSALEYRRSNDTVRAFFDDVITLADTDYKSLEEVSIPSTQMFNIYGDWCSDYGLRRVSRTEFARILETMGISRRRVLYKKSTKWCFTGIKFSADSEYVQDNKNMLGINMSQIVKPHISKISG